MIDGRSVIGRFNDLTSGRYEAFFQNLIGVRPTSMILPTVRLTSASRNISQLHVGMPL